MIHQEILPCGNRKSVFYKNDSWHRLSKMVNKNPKHVTLKKTNKQIINYTMHLLCKFKRHFISSFLKFNRVPDTYAILGSMGVSCIIVWCPTDAITAVSHRVNPPARSSILSDVWSSDSDGDLTVISCWKKITPKSLTV